MARVCRGWAGPRRTVQYHHCLQLISIIARSSRPSTLTLTWVNVPRVVAVRQLIGVQDEAIDGGVIGVNDLKSVVRSVACKGCVSVKCNFTELKLNINSCRLKIQSWFDFKRNGCRVRSHYVIGLSINTQV